MRSTLGFPTRRNKPNATCVSTHSIWLCYFRNLVHSQQQQHHHGLTTSSAACISSQRAFSTRSSSIATKAIQQRRTLHLWLLTDLDQHMPYLIKPPFSHRHFRARSKPVLASHSAATASKPAIPSKDLTTAEQPISSSTFFNSVRPQDDSSVSSTPLDTSDSATVKGMATIKPQRHSSRLLNPRWFNKTNNIDLQLEQLKGNHGCVDASFIFKSLRSMLYNASQYNHETAWKIYQAMLEHQVIDYMRANHYGHLLNMIKYAPNATPKLLAILKHMKAAQEKGQLVIGGRHYSQIMYGMSRQGDVAAICDVLRTLSPLLLTNDGSDLVQSSWYTSLATAAKKRNDAAATVKAAELMEQAMRQGVVMEREACAVMISALSVDMDSTAKFLTTMKETGMMMTLDNDSNSKYTQTPTAVAAAESAKYNVHVYTSLISGLAQKGDAISARRLWKDMRNNNIRPTTATYAAMIEAYGRVGNFKSAISLMKKYTYGHQGQLNKVMATSVLTNTIRHGKLDVAKSLITTWMDTMGLDMDKMDVEFRSAVLWVKAMDDMGHARNYFESLYTQNPVYVDSMMVNHLVQGFGNVRQKQDVLDSFELHDHVPPSSSTRTHQVWPHAFLVDALFKCRDVPAALSSLVIMRQYSVPDEITLAMVIRGLVMNDESQLAWALFQTMRSTGIEPNLRAYSSILKASIKGAQRGAAKQQQQQQPHIPGDLIEAAFEISSNSIRMAVDDNKKLGPTQAYILFRKMTGFQKPNVYTYTTLIACFAKHNLQRAMDIFGHMRAEGVEPVVETYVALLQGCAIFRHAPLALTLCKHLQEQPHVTPNDKVWHYLLKSLVRARIHKSEIDKIRALIRADNGPISGS